MTELPFNDYLEYYGPDFRLHLNPSNMENLNDPKYLEKTRHVLDYLIFHSFISVFSIQFNNILKNAKSELTLWGPFLKE